MDNKISILTVTYSKDFDLMLLQAESLEKFVIEPITHYVYIQDGPSSKEWRKNLEPIYKKHKLMLLHSRYEPLGHPVSGWVEQQYLKLVISKDLKDEYILVLDTKNIFVKNTSLIKEFYGKEGTTSPHVNVLTHDEPWAECWKPWIRLIENKIGLTHTYARFPATPFIFKKENIEKLHEKIDLKPLILEGGAKCMVSEFMLYYFFANDDWARREWVIQSDVTANNYMEYPGFVYTIFRDQLMSVDNYPNLLLKFLTDIGFSTKIATNAVFNTIQNYTV